MIMTSKRYRAAIKADTELTSFRARFGFIPEGAIEGAAVSSDGSRTLSDLTQLCDGIEESIRYATLELGRWKLDSSFDIIDEAIEQQTGYMSDEVCGEDGVFSTPPVVYYTMDAAYDIIGVTVCFDEAEYAKKLTLEYYGADDVLIQSQSFTNDDAVRVFSIEYPCEGVKRIAVKINEWSEGWRFAKIAEILPGEIFIFDGTNTFSFEHYDKINPFENALEFPQFRFKFDNSDKKFDVVNPKGLAAYLRQKMLVSSKIGLYTGDGWEYVSTGDFYLYSWPTIGQNSESEFTCKPYLAFKDNVYYRNALGSNGELATVADVAAKIFEFAGIDTYFIHETLRDISVNSFVSAKLTVAGAMSQLAIAALGYWKFERDGSVSLLPIPTELTDINGTLTYDELYEVPDIEQENRVTSVNVIYHAVEYDEDAGEDVLSEKEFTVSLTPDDGEVKELESRFIPSKERAKEAGEAALKFYALRLKHTVSYRGDMSVEAGDILAVENDYGVSPVLVTEHSVVWNTSDKLGGALAGVGG